jgi:hypothetical protein
MKSLSDLNTFSETEITFEDPTFTGVIFDRSAAIDTRVSILEGEDFEFVPGIKAISLSNPLAANISITFDVSSFTDVTLTFSLSGTNVNLSVASNFYTLSNIQNIADFNAALFPTVNTITYADSANHDFNIPTTISSVGILTQFTMFVTVQVADLFSTGGLSSFASDSDHAITNAPNLQTASGATFTVIVTPSEPTYVDTITCAGTLGGTFNYGDDSSDTLTIIGTKDQVNAHLNSMTMTTSATATADFSLEYSVTNDVNAEGDIENQTLTSYEYITKTVYTGTYTKNSTKNLSDGPRISNNANEDGTVGNHELEIAVTTADSGVSNFVDLTSNGAIGYWQIDSANKSPEWNYPNSSLTGFPTGYDKVWAMTKTSWFVSFATGSSPRLITMKRYDFDQSTQSWSEHSTVFSNFSEYGTPAPGAVTYPVPLRTEAKSLDANTVYLGGYTNAISNYKILRYHTGAWDELFDQVNFQFMSFDGNWLGLRNSNQTTANKVLKWRGVISEDTGYDEYTLDTSSARNTSIWGGNIRTQFVGDATNQKLWIWDADELPTSGTSGDFYYDVYDVTSTDITFNQTVKITPSSSIISGNTTNSVSFGPLGGGILQDTNLEAGGGYRKPAYYAGFDVLIIGSDGEHELYSINSNTTLDFISNGETRLGTVNASGNERLTSVSAVDTYFRYQLGGYEWDNATGTLLLEGTKAQINTMLDTLSATIGNTNEDDLILTYTLDTIQGDTDTAVWTLSL